jgi:hypothetical protein
MHLEVLVIAPVTCNIESDAEDPNITYSCMGQLKSPTPVKMHAMCDQYLEPGYKLMHIILIFIRLVLALHADTVIVIRNRLGSSSMTSL